MALNENHQKLKEKIEQAINDHKITRSEYDMIIHIASEDGIIDNHEQALLEQLQDMIENKSVRFVAE